MFESSISNSYRNPAVTASDEGLHTSIQMNENQKNREAIKFSGRELTKREKFSKVLLIEKLTAARLNYEPTLSAKNQAIHTNNQARIAETISVFKQRITAFRPAISPEDVRLAIEKNIAEILTNAKFVPDGYRAASSGDPHGYGKYLLFSDPNGGAPFCLQYFRFAAYQKTVIHDHPCECTSYVVSGKLRERTYEIIAGELKKTQKDDRYIGSLRAIDLSRNEPHSIKNKSTDPAGSVHVYRIDGVKTAAAVLHRYDPALRQKKLPGAKKLLPGLDEAVPHTKAV